MIEEGLYKQIISDANVTAILGTTRGDQSTGVFPNVAVKEPTLPFVVYEQIANDPVESTQGLNRLQAGRFRFHCYAADPTTARKLRSAIKKTLGGLLVTLSDSDATPVQGIWPILEAGDVEMEPRATIYNRVIDFMVWYVDTTN